MVLTSIFSMIEETMLRLILILTTQATFTQTYHITHDISSQPKCSEVTGRATWDCRWKAGMNRNIDNLIVGGKIAAYKIQWVNGTWSGW